MTPYTEHVPPSRWFTLPMFAASAATTVLGLLLLVRRDQVFPGVVAAFSGGVLVVVMRLFTALRVEVGERTLHARFGPLGFTLAGEEIEAVTVAPYRWLTYGGWGLRRGRDGGRSSRARSAPFVRTGVVVDTLQGRRYYVTSRRPDELAAAVNRPAEEATGR